MNNNLKPYRQKRGFTQKEVALMLGKSESMYCMMESGKRRVYIEDAHKLSDILKISINRLFPKMFTRGEIKQKTVTTCEWSEINAANKAAKKIRA